MTFSDLSLPKGIEYGATGGLQYQTEVMQAHGGVEFRDSKWSFPISRYNLSPSIDSIEKVRSLQAFFRIHKGKAIGFRFRDHLDYRKHNQIIAQADGKKRKYKLFKSYEHGNHHVMRRIYKPVKGTVKIMVDNNYDEGTFTLKQIPKPGAVIAASFEFDIPVRFDTDYLNLSPDLAKVRTTEIPIVEIKNVLKCNVGGEI